MTTKKMHKAVFGSDSAIGGFVTVFVQGMAFFAEVTELWFIKCVARCDNSIAALYDLPAGAFSDS